MNPTSCLSDHGLHRILSSYWLAHFYLMETHQSAALLWFVLRDVGILYSRAVIQRQLMSLSHIWSTVRRKDRRLSTCKLWSKQALVWIYFCMKQLRTLNSYQILKIKNKKSKTYSGWGLFQSLSNGTTLMQIQSGPTVTLNSSEKRREWRSLSNYRLVQLWAGAGPAHPAAAHNTCKVSLCYGSSLGSNPDISQKYNMDDISKGMANTI